MSKLMFDPAADLIDDRLLVLSHETDVATARRLLVARPSQWVVVGTPLDGARRWHVLVGPMLRGLLDGASNEMAKLGQLLIGWPQSETAMVADQLLPLVDPQWPPPGEWIPAGRTWNEFGRWTTQPPVLAASPGGSPLGVVITAGRSVTFGTPHWDSLVESMIVGRLAATATSTRPGPMGPGRRRGRSGPRWLSRDDETAPPGPRAPVADKATAHAPPACPGESEPPASGSPARADANRPSQPRVPDSVLQFLAAETPRELGPDDESELVVTLSGADIDLTVDGVGGQAQVQRTAILTIRVLAEGAVGLTDDATAQVLTQSARSSTRVSFPYRTHAPGIGRLTTLLFNGSEPVLKLESEVLVSRSVSPRAGHASSASWQKNEAQTDVVDEPRRHNTLQIHSADGGKLQFWLHLDDGPDVWHHGLSDLHGQRGVHASAFLKEFEALRQSRLPFEKVCRSEAQNLGSILADLLPESIRSAIWDHREELDQMALYTPVAKWPWEMCCLSSPSKDFPPDRQFLGDRGLIRRWYNHEAPRRIDVSGPRVICAPDYTTAAGRQLRHGRNEARQLTSTHGFVAGATSVDALDEFMNGGRFAMFHFAGHSVMSPGLGNRPSLVMSYPRFSGEDSTTLESGFTPHNVTRRSASQRRPLVFLNACTTGGQLESAVGWPIRGFPEAFMEAGAGAFIGTHWEVEDGPAARFASRFYEEFLGNRRSLAESTIAARSESTAEGWSPTPLAYVVYGHPAAVAVG